MEFTPPWAWVDGMNDWPHNMHGGIKFDPKTEIPNARTYTAVDEIRVRAFQDHFWGNWGFLVQNLTFNASDDDAAIFTFSGGGWQEATGTTGAMHAPTAPASWFVENVKQELDSALEWYFDAPTSTLLYVPADGQAPDTTTDVFVASELITLIAVNSSASAPSSEAEKMATETETESETESTSSSNKLVTGVTLNGLTFTGAAPTFYERYTASGPGDWSIYKGGAVYLRGVTGATVSSCVFDSLGGNGLFMHDWVKESTVFGNEFLKLGDNAIAATGWYDLSNPTDQTHNRFPSDNVIESNHIHNIGIVGKQVACYHQSIACHNTVKKNVRLQLSFCAVSFCGDTRFLHTRRMEYVCVCVCV